MISQEDIRKALKSNSKKGANSRYYEKRKEMAHYCEVCDRTFDNYYYLKHITSKRHEKVLELKEKAQQNKCG